MTNQYTWIVYGVLIKLSVKARTTVENCQIWIRVTVRSLDLVNDVNVVLQIKLNTIILTHAQDDCLCAL
jgi:hypothetical protein